MSRQNTWKRGYKVVAVVDGRWQSFVVALEHGGVEYAPGISARPKPRCGPLMVCATLEYARDLLSPVFGPVEIWTCRYRPSRATKAWVTVNGHRESYWRPKGPLAVEVVLEEKVQ